MFKGLKISSDHKPISPEAVTFLRQQHAALRSTFRYATARDTIAQSLHHMDNIVGDFRDLRRLGLVIKTYGANRSLMAFVRPVTKIVPDFPSFESFDLVPVEYDDPRTLNTLSGIDETINKESEVVADWIRTRADNVREFLCAAEDQIRGLEVAISHYLQTLEVLEENDVLSETTLTAAPFNTSLCLIEALLNTLPDLDVEISDPTDRDAMDTYKTKVETLADCLSYHTDLCLDPENMYKIKTTDSALDRHRTTDTFEGHGYTIENVITLLKKADNLVDEVNCLIERKEEIINRFHCAAVMVTDVDNDVTPAIDDASDDVAEESFGIDSDLTQVDLIYSQVSSHICCITTVVNTSIAAVEDVLSVAEHVITNIHNETTED